MLLNHQNTINLKAGDGAGDGVGAGDGAAGVHLCLSPPSIHFVAETEENKTLCCNI
ncbi:hypothetical protein HanPI659440_Chr14g0573881 [Helianthus annuus]|nr:hypothetical protein HanPI659440_Chr14g0573881 [Helianthus annuus]